MPGLTAPLTEPYDAAINTLLNRISSGLSDEAVVQQLEQPEKHNVLVLETAFRDNFYRILVSDDPAVPTSLPLDTVNEMFHT